MQHKPHILRLALILLVLTPSAWAGEDLVTSHLVGQARHWQAKDRDDFAAEIWRTILRSDPTHGEALIKLGLIEARAGNQREADALLEQANRVSPRLRGLAERSSALSSDVSKKDTAVLPPARASSAKEEIQPKERKSRNTATKKTGTASTPDAMQLKP